jgi:hypothetical protein
VLRTGTSASFRQEQRRNKTVSLLLGERIEQEIRRVPSHRRCRMRDRSSFPIRRTIETTETNQAVDRRR